VDLSSALNIAIGVAAFAAGAAAVYRLSGPVGKSTARPNARPFIAPATQRPASHMPIRGFTDLCRVTETLALLSSVERKTRFSQANFQRDCLPVLEQLADFVQMLPASESHHHAHPGGLWQHLLEVADAALGFRAGLELPPGAATEERKRLEHRWTYAVFVAALLHDVGKPVTDVLVTLYTNEPRDGRAWAPLAGPMRSFGAHWYSIAFADSSERDYQAHAKLGAMLLHGFVPPRVSRWLAEDSDILAQLLAYLSGEDKDGALGSIIKRADSDSVRRNLLHGPRTRFASARTRPLVERLMEALRRMLVEGGTLPLNRPGAAGWVYDGKVWFVCARLADEVRAYLSQHESLQGVPGKDKNDRLFDTWQEYGAVDSAPDGGAIWRVRVECEAWSPPDAFTVLCFPLKNLYSDASLYPAPMKGRVLPVGAAPTPQVGPQESAPAGTGPVALSSPVLQREPPANALPASAMAQPVAGISDHTSSRPPSRPANAAVTAGEPSAARAAKGADAASATTLSLTAAPAAPALVGPVEPVKAHPGSPPDSQSGSQGGSGSSSQSAASTHPGTAGGLPADTGTREPSAAAGAAHAGEDTLPVHETARAELVADRPLTTPELGSPLRPREKGQRPPGAVSSAGRSPSPAATAFMAWVAQSVGSGSLKYNEDGALVHFVPEGALLLSPEIFRRFLSEHESVGGGPIADLRQSHGDRAFARLQNELAKSGWTVRNGDENMHYYAFTKADKTLSRTASFCLIGKPDVFWNPVPAPNERITRAPRPKRMALPVATHAGAAPRSTA
jgi:integrating conjugative element relaxase (TIGR03760 family)